MKIDKFKLERYFGQHEFTAKYLLSSSDCDGYALKYVLDQASPSELALWDTMKLGYTESEGSSLLRESILQYYNVASIDNIVVASPGELNFAAMNVLLDPSDHVITVSPCYQSLYQIVKSINCELSYWLPDTENWNFDFEELEALIQPNTKLIVLNFPHNPTGSYLTITQLNEIVRIAEKNNTYIFSDEMYHKLIIDDIDELPPICELYNKGISLWGTSKSFGLAGLRLGWLVSQDIDFLKKIIAFKDYLSICSNTPSELLTTIALNNLDKFLSPNIEKIKRNVALFKTHVQVNPLFDSFIPPRAGSTSFVQLNVKSSALEFSNLLLAHTGIMTVPSEMFEYHGKYIRVGFGRQNFPETLEALQVYTSSLEPAGIMH